MATVLAVHGLDAFYGKAQALFGIELDVAAGEVVVIVGPSGAGKSTLARCLVGVWPDTSQPVWTVTPVPTAAQNWSCAPLTTSVSLGRPVASAAAGVSEPMTVPEGRIGESCPRRAPAGKRPHLGVARMSAGCQAGAGSR